MTFIKPLSKTWMAPAAAVAIFALAGAPQAALAGAKAFSAFQITDLIFFDAATGNALVLDNGTGTGDIAITSFNHAMQNQVTRFSGPGAGNDETADSDTNPNDGLALDPPMACVGPGCGVPGENNFNMGDFNSDEYNRADSLVNGTGLDLSLVFIPGVPLPPGSVVDPFDLNLVAEAITMAGATDAASSSNVNTTGFIITPIASPITVGVEFDWLRELWVGLHPETSGSATASLDFQITVRNADTGARIPLTTAASSLNDELEATVADTQFMSSVSDSFSATTTLALQQGVNYSFTFRAVTLANLNATKLELVPEPAPLALLGLGLIGAFAVRRRRAHG